MILYSIGTIKKAGNPDFDFAGPSEYHIIHTRISPDSHFINLVESTMAAMPQVPPHSLQPFGETPLLQLHDLERLGVRLCHGRLKPRERTNNDIPINVVYIVGMQTSKKGRHE